MKKYWIEFISNKEVNKKETIFQKCFELGKDLPCFCYQEKLSMAGNRRGSKVIKKQRRNVQKKKMKCLFILRSKIKQVKKKANKKEIVLLKIWMIGVINLILIKIEELNLVKWKDLIFSIKIEKVIENIQILKNSKRFYTISFKKINIRKLQTDSVDTLKKIDIDEKALNHAQTLNVDVKNKVVLLNNETHSSVVKGEPTEFLQNNTNGRPSFSKTKEIDLSKNKNCDAFDNILSIAKPVDLAKKYNFTKSSMKKIYKKVGSNEVTTREEERLKIKKIKEENNEEVMNKILDMLKKTVENEMEKETDKFLEQLMKEEDELD